jgi:single-stranded DNA-binding protein
MNDLNSVLIEGKINGEVETKTTGGETVCIFWIASNQFFKNGKIFNKETSFFKIETTEKLAEAVIKEGCDDRRIRIVGRLKQKQWEKNGDLKSEVVIIPEHIGFNPMFKKQ